MNRGLQIGVAALAVTAIVVAAVALQPSSAASETRATVQGLQRDENTDKFARAFDARDFEFPRDHGPHDAYQTEWWYYTGNLFDATGRHFGYQITFFRRALIPPEDQASVASRPSDFAFSQLYFAHFAVTDTGDDEHVSFDKFSRAAAGLAGAQAQPFKVFIEDWSAESNRPDGSAESVRLQARGGGYAIELDLESSKPMVFHGDRGLSQKSLERGNASYYYSMTRMATRGKVLTPLGAFEVSGNSWLDREWSTSALAEDVEGWDWFSLQADDNRELMYFKLREANTGITDFGKGTYVAADGSSQLIPQDGAQVTVLDRWTSPDSGATYPVRWRMTVPAYGLDVEIVARVEDQEMKLAQRYWEGAVTFSGTSAGQPISGVGYVELTGYK